MIRGSFVQTGLFWRPLTVDAAEHANEGFGIVRLEEAELLGRRETPSMEE